MNPTTKYTRGQRITCNGNPEGSVLGYYSERMVQVRLWSGFRHVGDVVVSEHDLDLDNTAPRATTGKGGEAS